MAMTLRLRGDTWHARGTVYVNTVSFRIAEFSTRYKNRDEAEAFLVNWEREYCAQKMRAAQAAREAADVFRVSGSSHVLPQWVASMWRETKKRALRHGILFDLSESDMLALFERSGGRCEVSGIVFKTTQVKLSHKRPYIPSLDRIRSADGYTLENCRLVCCAVNMAMNDWGAGPLINIAKGIASRKKWPGYPN